MHTYMNVDLWYDDLTTGDKNGRSLTSDHYVVQQPTVIVRRLFLLPCITEKDVASMEASLVEFCYLIKVNHDDDNDNGNESDDSDSDDDVDDHVDDDEEEKDSNVDDSDNSDDDD